MLQIQQDFPLQALNTFGMKVSAAYFSVLQQEDDLLHLEEYDAFKKGVFLLGGGSNVLFTGNVPYWVVQNKIKGIEHIKEDEEHVWIRVGAGENWHQFVLYCVGRNYGGVENLSLIPGTVGASPIQNIGAYGIEIKDVLEEVRFRNLETRQFETFKNEDCAFGYRDSIFKRSLKGRIIITSVVFKLNKIPVFNTSYGNIQQELAQMGVTVLSVKSISDAVIRIRTAKLPDPKEIGNAGSFFKNPEVAHTLYLKLKEANPDIPGYKVSETETKIPAGWLIEQCGWKGFREDDYGVHKNQALVLVNYGDADGSAIADLSLKIMASVKDRFGIDLEREVQIM